MKRRAGYPLGLGLVLGALCIVEARAQINDAGVALTEIVVTAEKRESSLQKTTQDVQVVNQDQLSVAGVRDFSNIDKIDTNLQVFEATGSTVISIRGLRSQSFDPTDESPNAVHIDGAYIARATALNGLFYDIQRVEILAGPQGTLYGRNSASGAINIITNKPGPDFGGEASVETGNYNLLRTQGAVNLPVSDTLWLRIAAISFTHDGYAKSGLDDADQQGGRFEALWQPDDRQSLRFTTDLERDNPRGVANYVIGVNPAREGPNNFTVPSDVRDDTQIDGESNKSRIHQTVFGASTQYDYHFDAATFTVQAAHRELSHDQDAQTLYELDVQPARSQSNSIETRIASNLAQQFQYVAGLFYFDERASGRSLSYVPPSSPDLSLLIDLSGQKTNSGAAFGQLTWTPALLDALHLTAGGRFNYDRKSAASQEIIFPIVNYAAPYQSKTWTKVTWKAGASYDLSPVNLVYANVSTGYKSGGFTYGAEPITPPQTITAFEVGSKNRFLAESLQVNFDAYKYDYKNFETTYLDTATFPPVLNVATAGTASIKGVDVDTLYLLTRDDNVHASVAYLDTKFGSLNLAEVTGIPSQPNLSGYPLPDAPLWSALGGYTHTFHLAGGATVDPSVNVQYGGKRVVLLPAQGAPAVDQGSYVITDLSLRFVPSSAKWNVTAYCNNVGNRYYLHFPTVNVMGPTAGVTTASLSPPRTYGVIIGAHF